MNISPVSCLLRGSRTLPLAVLVLVCAFISVAGQEPIVSKHSDAAPGEVAASLHALLAPGGARVQIGQTMLDLWWVKAVPLAPSASGAPAWPQVEEGTFVGAMRVAQTFADVRGRVIPPGVYTLRFAWQPQNGDHLGVSPFREFFLLSPAAEDTDPKALGYDATVELSKKASGVTHPAALSLDPPAASEPLHGLRKNDEFNLTAVIVEIPAMRGGQPAGALRFGLVVKGIIEA